jgi:hypothetical protein
MGLGGEGWGGRGGGKRARLRRKRGIDVTFLQCGWSPWLISSTLIFIVRRGVEMICNDFAGACGRGPGTRDQGIGNRAAGWGSCSPMSQKRDMGHPAFWLVRLGPPARGSRMSRMHFELAIALWVGALLSVIGLAGCRHARPRNAPVDSVYVNGPFGEGWWQHCSYLAPNDVDRCQIYNWGGGVIWDEVFVPYDGESAVREPGLTIDNETRFAGPQYVCLKNGRILIPKSHFEDTKRFLDWRTGKSKTR